MPVPVAAAAVRSGASKATASKATASKAAGGKAAAAARPPAAAAAAAPPSMPKVLTDNRGAPGWWARPGDGIKAANAGGGFALGLVTYVVVLSYLRGGRDGVKALLKAKFFNEVPA